MQAKMFAPGELHKNERASNTNFRPAAESDANAELLTLSQKLFINRIHSGKISTESRIELKSGFEPKASHSNSAEV